MSVPIVGIYLAKSVAIGTFPTESEQVLHLYDEDPPIWYRDRPPVHERSDLVITKKMAPRRGGSLRNPKG